MRAVHHDAAHADEHVVVDAGAVQDDAVADGDPLRPTTSGKPGSECSVQPSWTLEPAPISITSASARATAPYQMLDRGPIVTAPTTTAVGATKASSSIFGAPKSSSPM